MSYHITVFKNPNASLTFKTLAGKLGGIANSIIPFLIAVAFVAIIWGIFTYLRSAGDTEKVAEGRRVVLWGVFALFLIFTFWGFVIMVCTSLFGVCPPR